MSTEFENWDDLRVVLALKRGATLSGAARILKVDQTTVSRRIKALEERLGEPLFERGRGELTQAAQRIARAAERIEQVTFDLELERSSLSSSMRGPIKLTLPVLFASVWMHDLQDFRHAHPEVVLELVATDSLSSLTRRQADVAIRLISTPADHLFGRRLAQVALAVYGAPCWQDHPRESLPWIGWSREEVYTSTIEQYRRSISPRGNYVFWADAYMLIIDAMCQGVGVCVMPCILGDDHDQLVRISSPETLSSWLWVLTHEDLRENRRVRAMMEHLTRVIERDQTKLLGSTP